MTDYKNVFFPTRKRCDNSKDMFGQCLYHIKNPLTEQTKVKYNKRTCLSEIFPTREIYVTMVTSGTKQLITFTNLPE